MEKFKLNNSDTIALCDLLKRVGFCENGGHAKAVIADGEVSVDGETELRKRAKIRAGQVVVFQDQQVTVE